MLADFLDVLFVTLETQFDVGKRRRQPEKDSLLSN